MKSPFFGTRVLDNISLGDVVKFVDRKVLFSSRWQFGSAKEEGAALILEKLITRCEAQKIIQPKVVYGYFECTKQETAVLVHPSPTPLRGEGVVRFEFPRQRQGPHLCAADFFSDGFITMMLATVGAKVVEAGAGLFNKKDFSGVFFLRGLASELTEAVLKYGHDYILKELGLTGAQGCRFSIGYPMCPNLLDQKKLFKLLDGGRIGVAITETCHLVPEYSASAIISISQSARHFRP